MPRRGRAGSDVDQVSARLNTFSRALCFRPGGGMNNFSDKAGFLWSIAELLRDAFKRSKYQDVILPFTVLRRIDCVLEPTKPKVLATNAKLKGKKLQNV